MRRWDKVKGGEIRHPSDCRKRCETTSEENACRERQPVVPSRILTEPNFKKTHSFHKSP